MRHQLLLTKHNLELIDALNIYSQTFSIIILQHLHSNPIIVILIHILSLILKTSIIGSFHNILPEPNIHRIGRLYIQLFSPLTLHLMKIRTSTIWHSLLSKLKLHFLHVFHERFLILQTLDELKLLLCSSFIHPIFTATLV